MPKPRFKLKIVFEWYDAETGYSVLEMLHTEHGNMSRKRALERTIAWGTAIFARWDKKPTTTTATILDGRFARYEEDQCNATV